MIIIIIKNYNYKKYKNYILIYFLEFCYFMLTKIAVPSKHDIKYI